jgi:TatD-related deoxyribonuclease
MIRNLPVLDSHIHLDPMGTPSEAVGRFVHAGGTHLIVVHKPYHHLTERSRDDYLESFGTTIQMCDLANENGVKAWCVLGPYPGSLPRLSNEIGLEDAINLQLTALDLAFEMVDEGKALGIGEVGRIHFKVEEDVQKGSDIILRSAMRGAASRGCPVVLHTESPLDNQNLFRHLSNMADESGIPRKKIIKHYSGWEAANPETGLGLSVSMQARRKNVEEALRRDLDFLLETDYIDEISRPDVVMPPDTVPKKIEWAYRKGLLTAEKHEHLMVDLPREIMGIDTST